MKFFTNFIHTNEFYHKIIDKYMIIICDTYSNITSTDNYTKPL